MDGVQINQNGGFFDFQGFTLSNLDRIEVARGPQSALYGSSAVSGVVQFITPRGQAGPTRMKFVGEGGGAIEEGGSFRSTLSASGGSDSFQFSTGAGVAFNRGIYELANDTWTGDVSFRGDWIASDSWETTGLFRFVRYDGNLPVRDPGATRVPLDPNARNDRDRVVSSIAARFAPSTRWSHEFKGTLYWEDFFFQDTADGVVQPQDFSIFDFDLDFASSLLRPGFEYAGSYQTDTGGDRNLSLSFGGRVEREELSDHVDFAGDLSGTEFDRNSVAGFTEVLAQLSPRLSLLAGVRTERYEDLETQFTPRTSIVFDAIPNVLAIRGGWGQAYRVPNLQEQFGDNPFLESNPDLKPETSESVEVGFDVRARDGRFVAGFTYFDQDFDNLIRSVGQENDPRQIQRNLGKSEARGLEWSVHFRPVRAWTVGTEGSWVDTEILNNEGLTGGSSRSARSFRFDPTWWGVASLRLHRLRGSGFAWAALSMGSRSSSRSASVGAARCWGHTS